MSARASTIPMTYFQSASFLGDSGIQIGSAQFPSSLSSLANGRLFLLGSVAAGSRPVIRISDDTPVASGAASNGGIRFNSRLSDTGPTWSDTGWIEGNRENNTDGNSLSYLRFATTGPNNATANATEKMRIDSSGHLGIGTTAPSALLDVNGQIFAGGAPSSWSETNVPFLVKADSSARIARMFSNDYNASGTGMGIFEYFGAASGDTYYGINVKKTGAAVAGPMVLNESGGNVGIGKTSPATALDVSGTVTATAFSGPLTGTASGNTTYTANNHGVVISGSTNAMTVLAPDSSASKVLKSGGASADPSWLAYDNANTVSTLVARDSSGNFSAGTVTATLSGTATNATNTAITDDTSTNATMYPTWVTTTSGNLPQKVSSTKLTFNPSTATLTTTTFSGALSGNATTATTATNATNVATTSTATNSNYYPLFVASSSNGNQAPSLSTGITLNPSTNVVSAAAFTSSAANPAAAGVIRLANGDNLRFRNNANSADLALNTNSSDALSWAGVPFLSSAGVLLAAGFPAMTGDVTSSAGSLATTLASSISGGKTFSTSLTSPAYISSSSNPASAGIVRLANTDAIKWRNNANGADVSLTKDTSDQLSWGGTSFLSSAGVLLAAGEPAHTGDVTNSAGSLATTVAKIAGTTVSATTGSTNVMFSASPTTTGTLTASTINADGVLTLTRNGTEFSMAPATGTSLALMTIANTGGTARIGQEASVASQITGGTAYSMFMFPGASRALEIGYSSGAGVAVRIGVDGATTNQTAVLGAFLAPNLALSSAATTGTLCWTTGTGNVNVDTTVACLASTGTIKQKVEDLNVGLSEVMRLRPISYELKPEYNPEKLGRMVGFIAEEAQKIDDRLIALDSKGSVRGFRYMQYTAVITKAIQELNSLIAAQSSRMDTLESRIAALEKKPK